MKIGIALPYGSARSTARLARLAEEAGWDGCFVGDAVWCEDPMIGLAAAAMVTQKIRLGTMIIPAPLRKPWKIASESVALDHLTDGRLILGLGTGATWMGWQAFPDEITAVRIRGEILEETIEILTLLYQRKAFDYEGKHFHLKLTALDEMHYPPKPIQLPRIPIWVPGVWPLPKSMQRVLKSDGILVERYNTEGQPDEATPADVIAIKAYIQQNRTTDSPFDIVVSGRTNRLTQIECQSTLSKWAESGATWWVEACFGCTEKETAERIEQGP